MGPSSWKECAPAPFERFSIPVRINKTEFVITPFNVVDHISDGLYKFNTTQNQWSLFVNYPQDFDSTYHTSCYDPNNQILYIYNYEKSLTIIDIKTKSFKIIKDLIHCGVRSISFFSFYDCSLHLLLGSGNSIHWKWNNKQSLFNQIYDFKIYNGGMYGFGLIYIKSLQKILLFGGFNEYLSRDNIFSCDIMGDHKWEKLKLKLPITLCDFGYALTLDEQFIIIFGGYSFHNYIDCIWIWDLQLMQFKESGIKCPVKGTFHVIIMDDIEQKLVLIMGYFRKSLNIQFVSKDVIEMIGSWFCYEFVHLFQRKVCNHWRMNVNDIVNSVS